eukprot:TRINITY_DN97_c0_g1_i3.p1 TRINITY_DN97_c0_g1~~TRINITY_DN97_c0_g1_i3.p1  ORF type:complete len:668 (-),score=78.57 TRINITY_DN97_c0_g1_i3:306-2231(-)
MRGCSITTTFAVLALLLESAAAGLPVSALPQPIPDGGAFDLTEPSADDLTDTFLCVYYGSIYHDFFVEGADEDRLSFAVGLQHPNQEDLSLFAFGAGGSGPVQLMFMPAARSDGGANLDGVYTFRFPAGQDPTQLPRDGGDIQSAQDLSQFNGVSLYGSWSVCVGDHVSGNSGSITSLSIDYVPDGACCLDTECFTCTQCEVLRADECTKNTYQGDYTECPAEPTSIDDTAPEMETPSSQTLQCGASTLPMNTGEAEATDDCTAVPEIEIDYTDEVVGPSGETRSYAVPSSCLGGTVTRTWTATDEAGNMAEGVQVLTREADATNPMLTVPAGVPVVCGGDTSPASTGVATGTDNCDQSPSTTHSDVVNLEGSGSCAGGTITRTWMSTDECNNEATDVQIITVVPDTTNPMLTVPADVRVECGGDTSPASTGEATGADNCDQSVIITHSDVVNLEGSGPCAGGTITRTWVATDECNNEATDVQIITVVPDTTPPMLTVPADVSVRCGEDTTPKGTGTAEAIDNCDMSPVVNHSDEEMLMDVQGAECQEGTITRTWEAVDLCGNKASDEQIIRVRGLQVPSPPLRHTWIATEQCTSTRGGGYLVACEYDAETPQVKPDVRCRGPYCISTFEARCRQCDIYNF